MKLFANQGRGWCIHPQVTQGSTANWHTARGKEYSRSPGNVPPRLGESKHIRVNKRLIQEETQQQKPSPSYQNQSPQVETRLRVCLGGGWGMDSALLLRPLSRPSPEDHPSCSRCTQPVLSPPCTGLEVPPPSVTEAGPGPRNVRMPGAAWIPWPIQVFQMFLNGISEQGGLLHNQGQTGSCLPTFSEEICTPPPPVRREERKGSS